MMENDYLKKLEEVFDTVLTHMGDEELLSNINSEYNFDANDILYTDGFIVQGIIKDNDRAHVETAIRGGNYVIFADFINDSYRFNLYVNQSSIINKYDEIINNLTRLRENLDDISYYINDWRGDTSNDIKI